MELSGQGECQGAESNSASTASVGAGLKTPTCPWSQAWLSSSLPSILWQAGGSTGKSVKRLLSWAAECE